MNSNFSSLLTTDLVRSILERLSPSDLGRAACVCRLWKELSSDREILERAFRKPWKLARVIGSPSSAVFWRHSGIDRFAISHRLNGGDSVARLAVKYSVQVIDIKRMNNMMSEHGIYSRERLLIPIVDPNLLLNSTCFIELDDHAKREVAVLYLDDAITSPTLLPAGGFSAPRRSSRKLINSVRRSLHVDDETAAYYLSVSNGDPKNAILHFKQDLRWEQQQEEETGNMHTTQSL